jgi:hypothetical protein
MNPPTATTTAHITSWDRTVIILLGSAGCALSYDALEQMAVAIHVRGPLTYLFPAVIDGFIAYGVRALLVLRTAPLRARLYVWTLFGTATAASIWANALHAVRLNQQTTTVTGLRLGDTVVAILSTLAPLALAGAVHLYILIARGPAQDSDRGQPGHGGRPDTEHADRVDRISVTRTERPGHRPAAGHVSAGHAVNNALTGAPGQDTDRSALNPVTAQPGSRTVTGDSETTDSTGRDTGPTKHAPVSPDAHLRGHLDNPAPGDTGRPDNRTPVTGAPVSRTTDDRPIEPARPASDRNGTSGDRVSDNGRPVSDRGDRVGDRMADPDTDRLLEIAREAVKAQDKLTRKVVAEAIRGQDIPLSNDRLTDLMARLRKTNGQDNRAGRQLEDCLT